MSNDMDLEFIKDEENIDDDFTSKAEITISEFKNYCDKVMSKHLKALLEEGADPVLTLGMGLAFKSYSNDLISQIFGVKGEE